MSGRTVSILGLTGGIGSGKSTVSARLAALGARVLDADAVSRRLIDKGGACFARVVGAFGPSILRKEGAIDRGALASLVFSNKAARERLEEIVHPEVKNAMCASAEQILCETPDALVVLDVPLLFESGMDAVTDAVALVTAPEETRVARVKARDGADEADIRARIRAQMPDAEKRARADYVLDNGGTLSRLYAQTDALYAALTGRGL